MWVRISRILHMLFSIFSAVTFCFALFCNYDVRDTLATLKDRHGDQRWTAVPMVSQTTIILPKLNWLDEWQILKNVSYVFTGSHFLSAFKMLLVNFSLGAAFDALCTPLAQSWLPAGAGTLLSWPDNVNAAFRLMKRWALTYSAAAPYWGFRKS